MTSKTIAKLTLEEAKDWWEKILQKDISAIRPFMTYEWYETWVTVNHHKGEPYILLIDEKTIAPFVKRNETLQFTHEFTDFVDIIGPKDVWSDILEYIKMDGIKILEIENIRHDSPTVTFFIKKASLDPDHVSVASSVSAPFIPLPPAFEEYLASISTKRRKYNKFLRENPDAKLELQATTQENMDILIDLMHKKSIKHEYLNEIKEEFFRTIATTCADTRLFFVSTGGQIVGAQMLFEYNHRILSYMSGYAKDTHPNAGTFMKIALIKQAIERGFTEYSLLRGKEFYKYELGAVDFDLYSVIMKIS